MTTNRSFRRSTPFAVIVAVGLAGAGACGEAPEEEAGEDPIVTETSAFSEESCDSVIADTSILHPATVAPNNELSVTSPTTYNNCYKGYVVNIIHNEHNLPG